MSRIPLLIVSFFFLTTSTAHFVVSDYFIMAMPDYFGYQWELIIISGVFELLGAIGILIPKSRLPAGYGLIALCLAVFPANINMAYTLNNLLKLQNFFCMHVYTSVSIFLVYMVGY